MMLVIVIAVLGGWTAVVFGVLASLLSIAGLETPPSIGGRPINPALIMLIGIALAMLGLCSALCGNEALRLMEIERTAKTAAISNGKENK